MANYLNKTGWTSGLEWGFEVLLRKDYDYRRSSRGPFQNWAELGLVLVDGRVFLTSAEAILFFPTGASGPAFLVTHNFIVLKRYNDSDVYALHLCLLADRIHCLAPIIAAWPANDRHL